MWSCTRKNEIYAGCRAENVAIYLSYSSFSLSLSLSLSSSPPTECWPHMNHSPPSLSTFLMHCSAFRLVHVVMLSSRDNPRSSFSSVSWPYPLYDIFFSKQLPAFYVQSIAIFFLFLSVKEYCGDPCVLQYHAIISFFFRAVQSLAGVIVAVMERRRSTSASVCGSACWRRRGWTISGRDELSQIVVETWGGFLTERDRWSRRQVANSTPSMCEEKELLTSAEEVMLSS